VIGQKNRDPNETMTVNDSLPIASLPETLRLAKSQAWSVSMSHHVVKKTANALNFARQIDELRRVLIESAPKQSPKGESRKLAFSKS
jgi:hypothetical protein